MTRERVRALARAWYIGVLFLATLISTSIIGAFPGDPVVTGIMAVQLLAFVMVVETIP